MSPIFHYRWGFSHIMCKKNRSVSSGSFEVHTKSYWEFRKGRNHLGNLVADDRIILKLILKAVEYQVRINNYQPLESNVLRNIKYKYNFARLA